MGFGNTFGLYALLSLIPLIILYLRRPKPVDKVIPSLMFFIRQMSSSRQHSFFRKLLRNLLFLIQLMALTALSFALASPFVDVPGKAASQETVIVLDMSASMQTKLDSGTRFDKEIGLAKKALEGKVSIILAENVPIVVLEHGTRQEAERILSSLMPKDTPSNIGDAMLLASDLLKGKRGKVVVLSDLITTEGPDVLVAKRTLTSKDIEVNLVNVAGAARNIGIIDLSLGKSQSKAYVKNFDDEKRKITLDVVSGEKAVRYEKEVLPKSIETFVFDTPAGTSKLEIKEEDDFPVDNFAFISAPANRKISVLLVTNAKTSYVQKALAASPDIKLSVAHPPIIPSLDYQVIVMNDFSMSFLVPGFYKDIKRKVSNGTGLVVCAQQDIAKFDRELLPVSITDSGDSSTTNVEVVNQLTKDASFGAVSKYLKAKAKTGALNVVTADDDSPLIAMNDFGDGKIVYYGLLDDYSEFKGTTSYPIFWTNIMTFLTKTESLQDFNYKTGKVQAINEQTVETPYGTFKTSKLFFDKAGTYSVGEKKIAASLLNEKESDVSKEQKVVEEEKGFFLEKKDEKRRINLEALLSALALVIIIFELLYIKSRGDV